MIIQEINEISYFCNENKKIELTELTWVKNIGLSCKVDNRCIVVRIKSKLCNKTNIMFKKRYLLLRDKSTNVITSLFSPIKKPN